MKPTLLNDRFSERWSTAAIDHLVDRPLDGLLTDSLFSSLNNLSILDNNFLQTHDGYKLEVSVPGMCRKDLHLEVNSNVLTVQGRKQQKEESGWFKKPTEYRNIEIYKTFILPEDADADGIRAKCKDGLLKISIPKVKIETNYKSISVKAAAETKEMNWWQKLTKTLKALWNKGSSKMKQLQPGF